MNSWNQPQQQNNTLNPYWNMRGPVYKADPIHGKEAAWAFPIGGGEIWLPDADQDLVWWIRVDQNGNRQVKAFDVKPHEEPTPVDMENILARLGAVEEWINAKSSKSNAKRNNTAAAAAATVPGGTIQSVD